MIEDPVPGLRAIDRALVSAGIPYAVGGSLASSFYGEYRGTNDVDLLVEVALWNVAKLLAALEGEFDADEEHVRGAVSRGVCFNVIHRATSVKFDLFASSGTGFHRHQIDRRRKKLVDSSTGLEIDVVSPEDIVLQKLAWYRSSEGVPGGQLRDVVGVLVQQRGRLDVGYMDRMAQFLGLEALLADVRRQADLRP